MNVIIIASIALIVLALLTVIFIGRMKPKFNPELHDCFSEVECVFDGDVMTPILSGFIMDNFFRDCYNLVDWDTMENASFCILWREKEMTFKKE